MIEQDRIKTDVSTPIGRIRERFVLPVIIGLLGIENPETRRLMKTGGLRFARPTPRLVRVR
jgi:hypothetical protein